MNGDSWDPERTMTTCPAPCPVECNSCTRDRDCECYEHQHLTDEAED